MVGQIMETLTDASLVVDALPQNNGGTLMTTWVNSRPATVPQLRQLTSTSPTTLPIGMRAWSTGAPKIATCQVPPSALNRTLTWLLQSGAELSARAVLLIRLAGTINSATRIDKVVFEISQQFTSPSKDPTLSLQWRVHPGDQESVLITQLRSLCPDGAASSVSSWWRSLAEHRLRDLDTDFHNLVTTQSLSPYHQVRLRNETSLWASRLTGRRELNAHLVLHLSPPRGTGSSWLLQPALETGRHLRPLQTLKDPKQCELVSVELVAALKQSQKLKKLLAVHPPTANPSADIPIDALEQLMVDLHSSLPRVQIPLRCPAGLRQPSPAQVHLTVTGVPTSLQDRSLLITPEVAIGGVRATGAEVKNILKQPNAIVSLSNQWMWIDGNARQTLAASTTKKTSPRELLLARGTPGVKITFSEQPRLNTVAEVTPDQLTTHPDNWLAQLLSGDLPDPAPTPARFEGDLYEFQAVALAWLLRLEHYNLGGLLNFEVGLGKGVVALALVASTAASSKTTLVVCPPHLVHNWKSEASKFAPSLQVGNFVNTKPTKSSPLPPRTIHTLYAPSVQKIDHSDIVLCTYPQLARHAGVLAEKHWHRIILDEAQHLSNRTSATARAAFNLSADHRHTLSATPPTDNRLRNLFSFVLPGLVDKMQLSVTSDDTTVDRSTSSTNQRLKHITAPFTLTKTRPTTASQLTLPEVTEGQLLTYLGKSQKDRYRSSVNRLLAEVESSTGMARYQLITTCIAELNHICGPQVEEQPASKQARLTELIGNSSSLNQATVVFARSATDLEAAAEYIEMVLGISTVVLSSATPASHRAKIIRQFAQSNGPEVLFTTPALSGTGLNLTRANHMVHLDTVLDPDLLIQSNGRIVRIGQTRPVRITYLTAAGTFQQSLYPLLVKPSPTKKLHKLLIDLTQRQLSRLLSPTNDDADRPDFHPSQASWSSS